MTARHKFRFALAFLLFLPLLVQAALPAVTADVRYMSLGDSLAAGYKALPATKGFAYQLYLNEVFGKTPDTVFANAAVPGAKSSDVLGFQIPQVGLFSPNVVTISVGGNDLLVLLASPDPIAAAPAVLGAYATNLGTILSNLCFGMPVNGEIYLNNLYTIPEVPGADQVVPLFNSTMTNVVANVKMMPACADKKIEIADVYNAFLGQKGLLLIERYLKKGIMTVEVHPTNKGHRVMEDAYRAVIGR